MLLGCLWMLWGGLTIEPELSFPWPKDSHLHLSSDDLGGKFLLLTRKMATIALHLPYMLYGQYDSLVWNRDLEWPQIMSSESKCSADRPAVANVSCSKQYRTRLCKDKLRGSIPVNLPKGPNSSTILPMFCLHQEGTIDTNVCNYF